MYRRGSSRIHTAASGSPMASQNAATTSRSNMLTTPVEAVRHAMTDGLGASTGASAVMTGSSQQ